MSTPKQPQLNLNEEGNEEKQGNKREPSIDLRNPMEGSNSFRDSSTGYFTPNTSMDFADSSLIFPMSEEPSEAEVESAEPKESIQTRGTLTLPSLQEIKAENEPIAEQPLISQESLPSTSSTASNTNRLSEFVRIDEENEEENAQLLSANPQDIPPTRPNTQNFPVGISSIDADNYTAAKLARFANELQLFLLMRELIEFPFLVFAPAAFTAGATRTLINWLVETHFPATHSELSFALNAAIPSITANIVFAAGTYRRENLRNAIVHALTQDPRNLAINWEDAAERYPVLAPDRKWRETLKAFGIGFTVFTGFPYANRLAKVIGAGLGATATWEKVGIQTVVALGTAVITTAAFYLGMLAVRRTKLPPIVAFQVGLGVLGLVVASDLFRTVLNNDVGMQILREVLSCITAGLFACAPLAWQLDNLGKDHYENLPRKYQSPFAQLFFSSSRNQKLKLDEESALINETGETQNYGATTEPRLLFPE